LSQEILKLVRAIGVDRVRTRQSVALASVRASEDWRVREGAGALPVLMEAPAVSSRPERVMPEACLQHDALRAGTQGLQAYPCGPWVPDISLSEIPG